MSRRTAVLERRGRRAAALRLLDGAALLVLALALFRQPFADVLGPRIAPRAAALPLPAVLQRDAAPGFVIQITSEPAGAAVFIDGVERGRTPAILNVVCSEGQPVSLVVRHPDYAEDARTVPCRDAQTLKARITLRR